MFPSRVEVAVEGEVNSVTFGIGFIILLLALGGLAAYQGDRVGMAVGRRRLTIFGLRPKYTSRVVTVLTGVIIVSITMASVLLISHTARQSLFGLEDLQQQISDLSIQLASLQDRQRALQAENSVLQEENLTISRDNELLQEQNAALREQTQSLAEQRNLLLAEIEQLEDEYKYNLTYSRLVFDWLLQHPLVYTAGQVIDSYVIDVPDNRDDLKQAITEMLEELNAKVLRDGAGEVLERPGWALVLEYYRINELGEEEMVTDEQRIDELVDGILATPGLSSIVVQAISLTHSLATFPVYPDFNLFFNRLVFPEGATVDAHVFDGRASGRDLFNQVWAWLQGDVRRTAIDQGVLGRPDGTVTAPFDPGLLYDVVDKIRSYDGPVLVKVVAAEAVRTNDELTLAFVYEEITHGNE